MSNVLNPVELTSALIKCRSITPTSAGSIDLIISYGFKNLIKEPLISMPKIGCINFHPAPLPDWRGMGGVFNFALYEQVSEWGVSSHFVDNSFDTGDLIKVNNFKINSKNDNQLNYALNLFNS